MPKHVNEKAEAAKARKEDAKKQQATKAAKAQEDKVWQEAGEGAKSKAQAKRADTEAQRAEAAAKRAEARRLAELEEAALTKPKEPKKAPKVSGYKVRCGFVWLCRGAARPPRLRVPLHCMHVRGRMERDLRE